MSLEANDILSVHVRHEDEENAYSAVRIKTNQAPQIKKTLDRCLSGGVVPKRKFVRALEDYVTSEVNHLSFKQGDVIELVYEIELVLVTNHNCDLFSCKNRKEKLHQLVIGCTEKLRIDSDFCLLNM